MAALQCVRSYVDPAGAASGPQPNLVLSRANGRFAGKVQLIDATHSVGSCGMVNLGVFRSAKNRVKVPEFCQGLISQDFLAILVRSDIRTRSTAFFLLFLSRVFLSVPTYTHA